MSKGWDVEEILGTIGSVTWLSPSPTTLFLVCHGFLKDGQKSGSEGIVWAERGMMRSPIRLLLVSSSTIEWHNSRGYTTWYLGSILRESSRKLEFSISRHQGHGPKTFWDYSSLELSSIFGEYELYSGESSQAVPSWVQFMGSIESIIAGGMITDCWFVCALDRRGTAVSMRILE